MIKKIIVLLGLILSFINYSKADFTLIETGDYIGYAYNKLISVPLIGSKYVLRSTGGSKLEYKVTDYKGNQLSICYMGYVSNSDVYKQKIYQMEIYMNGNHYGNIVYLSNNQDYGYRNTGIAFIDNNGNCKDGFDLAIMSHTKNTNIVFAWKKDLLYFSDYGNSDYGYKVKIPYTTTGELEIIGYKTGFQEELANEEITYLADVGLPIDVNAKDYNIKSGYIYGAKLLLGDTALVPLSNQLVMYGLNSYLLYLENNSPDNLKKRIIGTGNNTFITATTYILSGNQQEEYIEASKSGIYGNMKRVLDYYLGNAGATTNKYYILDNKFLIKYLGSIYNVSFDNYVRENIQNIYYDELNYKLYNVWTETNTGTNEQIIRYEVYNLNSTSGLGTDNAGTEIDGTTTDGTTIQEELDFWDATASFFTNLINIVIDATTTPYENYEKLKEMINNLHSQEYVCSNTTGNNEIVISMSNVHNSGIDYLKTILYVLASIGWIYFLFIKM